MDTMSEKDQLYYAIKAFLEGKYRVKDFCSNFEKIYNLELDKKTLSPKELQVFSKLFDKASHYNENPEERKNWPGFTDENEIGVAVKEASKELDQSN